MPSTPPADNNRARPSASATPMIGRARPARPDVCAVVCLFIVVIGNLSGRLYPADSPPGVASRFPLPGRSFAGSLLHHYFLHARGSGEPQRRKRYSCATATSVSAPCSRSSAYIQCLWRAVSRSAERGLPRMSARRWRPGWTQGALSPASFKALVPTGASAAPFNTNFRGGRYGLHHPARSRAGLAERSSEMRGGA